MTSLIINRDARSTPTYSRKLSNTVYKLRLSALQVSSITVPTNMYRFIASYSPGTTVDARIGSAPADYTEPATLSSNDEQLPVAVEVQPEDVVYFKNQGSDETLVTVAFYDNKSK